MRNANQFDAGCQTDRDRWGGRDRDRWGGRDRDRRIALALAAAVVITLLGASGAVRTADVRATQAGSIRTAAVRTAALTEIRTQMIRTLS